MSDPENAQLNGGGQAPPKSRTCSEQCGDTVKGFNFWAAAICALYGVTIIVLPFLELASIRFFSSRSWELFMFIAAVVGFGFWLSSTIIYCTCNSSDPAMVAGIKNPHRMNVEPYTSTMFTTWFPSLVIGLWIETWRSQWPAFMLDEFDAYKSFSIYTDSDGAANATGVTPSGLVGMLATWAPAMLVMTEITGILILGHFKRVYDMEMSPIKMG